MDIQQWLGTGSINIFGRPFAGKDTQGKRLAELFDGILLGGGDILRNSTIPEHISAQLHKGELIPSEDYVSIVLPYLSKPEFADKPLILSSVGRWIGEEQGVIVAAEQSNHPLKAVIYLELSEDEVRRRWNALEHHDDRGGRHDDTAEILEKRLREFREKTLPVYKNLGLLITINGNQSREDVGQDILVQLQSLAQK
ncbi:MAG TPA: nucleoside monophosphate kinase [Candidatus Saccharibacteria bacterium]|nr:nucleoside monophosphate kinase [Candidatus Saccharibacteria bacterium]